MTRRVRLEGGQEILLTDTVGFVQRLPTTLVAAFRATLEEVAEADLLVHVVDASSPSIHVQIEAVEQVLEEIGAGGRSFPMIGENSWRCSTNTERLKTKVTKKAAPAYGVICQAIIVVHSHLFRMCSHKALKFDTPPEKLNDRFRCR